MDTLPNWFTPLARVFGVKLQVVASLAERWVVEECVGSARGDSSAEAIGRQAGLPPIRPYDLRHGTTLALAAGVDMKIAQVMLRHSSVVITADTHTSVLPELARGAAEKTAAIVPRRVRPSVDRTEATAKLRSMPVR
jgi:integrase